MELRHLRYFCSVAEHRSFTLAARQMNVSQSGVSGQISALELEIGVTLLRRNQREVALTPEGVAFWEEARDILVRADRAVELAQKASRGEIGNITIGLCGPVTALFLPQLIRTFRKRFTGVTLALKERRPAEQVQALVDREIDVGFTRSIATGFKHVLKSELLYREPVVAAIPKDHPFAGEGAIAVPQLANQPLVLCAREAGPEIFDPIVAMCKRAHFSPQIVESPNSWPSVLTMVEAGEGIALIPACVQQLRAIDVVFRPLRKGACRLDAIVAWRRKEVNAMQESFLALLREKRVEWAGTGPKIDQPPFKGSARAAAR